MQLTNIARDVGEDARAGRIYLPQQWLQQEGIDPEAWLTRPVFSAAIGRVTARLLRTAEAIYAQADEGIEGLPLACRPGINAARFLYAEIGREVERAGCDSVSRRAVVPAGRKAALLSQILQTAVVPRRCASVQPLPETRFLVEAAAGVAGGSRDARPARLSLSQVEDRAVWVLDLFERLERRDRSRRAAALGGGKGIAAA